MFLNFMTIQISVLDNFWSILISIFFGGTPLRTPWKKFKNLKIWKVIPVTPYNTQFLLMNLFVLSRIGCLQKTRAQNIYSYQCVWRHFCRYVCRHACRQSSDPSRTFQNTLKCCCCWTCLNDLMMYLKMYLQNLLECFRMF